jgi:hypothetical protein
MKLLTDVTQVFLSSLNFVGVLGGRVLTGPSSYQLVCSYVKANLKEKIHKGTRLKFIYTYVVPATSSHSCVSECEGVWR